MPVLRPFWSFVATRWMLDRSEGGMKISTGMLGLRIIESASTHLRRMS